MIDLKEGTFVSRIFYVELDFGGNFLATLHRQVDQWTLDYRIRKYADNSAFESMDEKAAFCLRFNPGVAFDTILERCRDVVRNMPGATERQELVVESDQPDVVIEKLSEQPWCHIRVQRMDGQPVGEA